MLMLDLPAKQRRPWDLAMTATKMTTMMMMATMTMAITGPVPAEIRQIFNKLSHLLVLFFVLLNFYYTIFEK